MSQSLSTRRWIAGAALVCAAAAAPAQPQPLATTEGPDGVLFEITDLAQDGKQLTLKGRIVNKGEKSFSPIGKLDLPGLKPKDPRANPKQHQRHLHRGQEGEQEGFAAVHTTQGACICTENLGFIKPGSSVPVFASFPAPTSGATEVDVMLPSFLPAQKLPISGAGAAGSGNAPADSAAPRQGKPV